MTTLLRSALLILVLLNISKIASSQYGYVVVVDSVHCDVCADPTCGPIDLNGFITYDVYVLMEPGDCLTGVFGDVNDLTPGVCFEPGDENNLAINFDGVVFNHYLPGGPYGTSNICALYPSFPCMEWDSYLTLCQECQTDAGNIFQLPLDACNPPDPYSVFTNSTGCAGLWDTEDFLIDSEGWFGPPGTVPCATAGADGMVQIAQFTTNGGFEMQFYYTFQPGCIVNTPIEVQEIDFYQPNPCTFSPMDTLLTATAPLCEGLNPLVELIDGGNGPVTYNFYSDDDGIIGNDALISTTISDDGVSFNSVAEGCYYFTMVDSVGCRDTSTIGCFTDPIPLTFEAEMLTDVLCFGETTGSIATTCTGGTGTVNVDVNWQQGSTFDTEDVCGTTFTGLGCGNYLLAAEDSNGCLIDTLIAISCPEQLVINITEDDIECFGVCDGALNGTVTGGTDPIEAIWEFDAAPFDTINGNTTLTVTIDELCAGTYTLSVTDLYDCAATSTFEITQPGDITLNVGITDVSCFGVCDGTILLNANGGTGEFDYACEDADTGLPVGQSNLCAGDYICTATDEEGCGLDTLITVGSPTQITYELDSLDVSCFGLCDGEIHVTNVQGGVPGYTFAIQPNSPGNELPTEVHYLNLCADTYEITITDNTQCAIVISDIPIIEPGELDVEAVVTDISCWGFNNGILDVTYTGGTGDVYLYTDPTTVLDTDSLLLPATIDSIGPGQIVITIQDATGCFDEEVVEIEEPTQLILTLLSTEQVGCGGDCDGNVKFEVVGGTPTYSYILYPEPGPPSIPLTGIQPYVIPDLCAALDTLIVQDLNLCTDTSFFEILEPDPIIATITEDNITCTGMCDGAAVVVLSGGTGILTPVFEPEDLCSVIVNDSTYALCELCQGIYGVEVFDEQGCAIEEDITIGTDLVTDMILTVFTSPETCWNEQDGTATIAVQNGNPPIYIQWNDPDLQTTATAVGLASNEVYMVTVTDSIGCTLDTIAFIEPTIGCFFIATAVTPNGDGVNDEWLVGGLEYFPDAVVQVFNRWGQLLFESRGYTAAWDGTYKGENLPTADYYFIIDYSPGADPITGTVTIKY